MNRTRRILLLPLVFVVTTLSTFFFYGGYRKMVRFFYKVFTHGKIHFFGKTTYQFPDDYFVLSFGVLCVVFAILLYRHTLKQRVYRSLFALALFILSNIIVSYARSTMALAECTACKGGILTMHVNAVPYDAIFISSGLAVVGLSVLTSLVRLLPVFSNA